MPMLRDIKVKMGLHEPPTPMQRATESVRSNPTLDRLKTRLGLQEKTDLQEIQDAMCPSLTYEQVCTRVPRPAHRLARGEPTPQVPARTWRFEAEPRGSLRCHALAPTQQRMYGFGICFSAGILLSLASMFSFTKLLLGYPRDFAIKYTIGNILAICSTGFLMGPARQLRNMTAAKRWVAALIYLFAMVMTLVSAFKIQIAMVTVLFIVIQFCAMVWYCLSYIPFGRQMLAKCCKGVLEG